MDDFEWRGIFEPDKFYPFNLKFEKISEIWRGNRPRSSCELVDFCQEVSKIELRVRKIDWKMLSSSES